MLHFDCFVAGPFRSGGYPPGEGYPMGPPHPNMHNPMMGQGMNMNPNMPYGPNSQGMVPNQGMMQMPNQGMMTPGQQGMMMPGQGMMMPNHNVMPNQMGGQGMMPPHGGMPPNSGMMPQNSAGMPGMMNKPSYPHQTNTDSNDSYRSDTNSVDKFYASSSSANMPPQQHTPAPGMTPGYPYNGNAPPSSQVGSTAAFASVPSSGSASYPTPPFGSPMVPQNSAANYLPTATVQQSQISR